MDNVADFLIRIKNSSYAGRWELLTPFSNFNCQIAGILEKEGFLKKVETKEEEGKKKLLLSLAGKGQKPTRLQVIRVSKPGRRVYLRASDLKKLRGIWTVIVSTPQGLLNAKEAWKKNLGGEIICKISEA